MAHKGRFFPRNPQKYLGNPHSIVFRSAWERTFMEYCDTTTHILQWASEELIVPYYFVGDSRWHRYYPDFVVNVQTTQNEKQTWMVEIKPFAQSQPPKSRGRNVSQRRQIREAVEYAKNQAKWTAAKAFCHNKGWRFVVLTEKDLYPNGK